MLSSNLWQSKGFDENWFDNSSTAFLYIRLHIISSDIILIRKSFLNEWTIRFSCLDSFLNIVNSILAPLDSLPICLSFIVHLSIHLHGVELVFLHVGDELSVAVEIWVLSLHLGSYLTNFGFLVLTKSVNRPLVVVRSVVYQILLSICKLDIYCVFMFDKAVQLVRNFHLAIQILIFDIRFIFSNLSTTVICRNSISFVASRKLVALRRYFVLIASILSRRLCSLRRFWRWYRRHWLRILWITIKPWAICVWIWFKPLYLLRQIQTFPLYRSPSLVCIIIGCHIWIWPRSLFCLTEKLIGKIIRQVLKHIFIYK